jgi:hypothetical protein
MSKGSNRRPTDQEKFNANWEKIFGVRDIKEEKKSQKETPAKKDK